MFHPLRFSTGVRASLLAIAALATTPLHAAWNALDLPSLSVDFASYQMAQLPDGRLIYATQDDIDRQTTFQTSSSGPVGLDDYTNAGSWFPSSVAVFNNTLGVVGKGNFGPSQLFTFDPSNLATPFTAIPNVTLQDYSVVFRDANSLYVGGLNGTGGAHAVSYVTLDGTSRLLIDNISTFSGAMAIDAQGNLFVTDNDNLSLYEFPAAQLSLAIALNRTLTLDDGVFLTTLTRNASIAVDAAGRIWAAGFQAPGLEVFDPNNGTTTNVVPNLNNTLYVVSTFSVGGTDYVGYLNAGGFFQGSTLTYGFDTVENLVPEPSSATLLLLGLAVFGRRRR